MSESKKELEKLIEKYNDYYIWNNTDKHSFDIIEEDLNRLEKQDKAIEILKRTCISQRRIMYTENYKEFKDTICYDYERVLTKEEYEIIKEVFG